MDLETLPADRHRSVQVFIGEGVERREKDIPAFIPFLHELRSRYGSRCKLFIALPPGLFAVAIEKIGEAWEITTMKLDVTASVPGIDDSKFQELANSTLTGCPVSKAFKGNVKLAVNAKLSS